MLASTAAIRARRLSTSGYRRRPGPHSGCRSSPRPASADRATRRQPDSRAGRGPRPHRRTARRRPDTGPGSGSSRAGGVAPSTGSVGDSLDIAVAESFFGSLNRADLPARLGQPARCRAGDLRLDRGLVQPGADHGRAGHAQPRRTRAAFYDDTANPNLDTSLKVGNHLSSLQ